MYWRIQQNTQIIDFVYTLVTALGETVYDLFNVLKRALTYALVNYVDFGLE